MIAGLSAALQRAGEQHVFSKGMGVAAPQAGIARAAAIVIPCGKPLSAASGPAALRTPVGATALEAAFTAAFGALAGPPGRARLSYRRAEQSFELATRPLANPGATREELEEAHGWTLHPFRHCLLTHEAEDGTSTPMVLARSRHASVRSLERCARPGPEAVDRHAAGRCRRDLP